MAANRLAIRKDFAALYHLFQWQEAVAINVEEKFESFFSPAYTFMSRSGRDIVGDYVEKDADAKQIWKLVLN